MTSFSLMIHGGAGAFRAPERYEASLRAIIEAGAKMLSGGASALDAVTHCVSLLEDDPLYNAGRGAVLNAEGEIFMDASIMDGRSIAAGAVAGVQGVRNPVRLARAVMEKSGHVLLIGAGAEDFARAQRIAFEDDAYFRTDERVAEHLKDRKGVTLDHHVDEPGEGKLGTVGAVARDCRGDLAAATSTGGLTNQARGRVGDSPVIGAGTYADNASCAVSCTGVGEHFLRTSLAHTTAFFAEHLGMDAEAAANAALDVLKRKLSGRGGLIVVDRNGVCARACSTPGILTATARDGTILVQPG